MLSFFPRDVIDEIWDLVGSVSEGFPSYFYQVCPNEGPRVQDGHGPGGLRFEP